MKYITYNEYLKYSSILQIAEQETEYGISEPQENRRYNQEELITQTNKIIEMIKDTKDKEEVKIMSPLTKMLLDLKLEGKEEGILSMAKKMLQRNMEIREIEEITGIPKEELEKLAKSEV